jgi:hypothetical protein
LIPIINTYDELPVGNLKHFRLDAGIIPGVEGYYFGPKKITLHLKIKIRLFDDLGKDYLYKC